VARVDQVNAFGSAAVVDREQMPARKREELGDAVRLEAARDQETAVGLLGGGLGLGFRRGLLDLVLGRDGDTLTRE
jgi:hypothetical protein